MLEKLIKEVVEFRNKRNWKEYHSPKDLAISISLEASELLENFQWSTSEESLSKKMSFIKEELADVLIYCILFADSVGLNIDEIIAQKLRENDIRYPVDKSYGKKEKYNEL